MCTASNRHYNCSTLNASYALLVLLFLVHMEQNLALAGISKQHDGVWEGGTGPNIDRGGFEGLGMGMGVFREICHSNSTPNIFSIPSSQKARFVDLGVEKRVRFWYVFKSLFHKSRGHQRTETNRVKSEREKRETAVHLQILHYKRIDALQLYHQLTHVSK